MTKNIARRSTFICLQVKTLTGKVITVEVLESEHVNDIKYAIKMIDGIPMDQQRLIFDKKQLQDGGLSAAMPLPAANLTRVDLSLNYYKIQRCLCMAS